MERNGVERGIFRSLPLEMHVISHRCVLNVFCNFLFVLLIDEDKGVMFRVVPIVDHPISTRMVGVVFITADGNVRRGRGRR
jgi:hypothetical protein